MAGISFFKFQTAPGAQPSYYLKISGDAAAKAMDITTHFCVTLWKYSFFEDSIPLVNIGISPISEPPKIAVEVVALLDNTLEIPGPNPRLKAVCSDSAFSQISSVTQA